MNCRETLASSDIESCFAITKFSFVNAARNSDSALSAENLPASSASSLFLDLTHKTSRKHVRRTRKYVSIFHSTSAHPTFSSMNRYVFAI